MKSRNLLFFLLTLCSCSTTRFSNEKDSASVVRKVDFSEAPEMEELAKHAQQFADEMYPKVRELLLSDDDNNAPSQFDLVFKPLKVQVQEWGATSFGRKRISIDPIYMTNRVFFEGVLVHEMAHVAMKPKNWLTTYKNVSNQTLRNWGESIASFAAYKLVGPFQGECPECNAVNPHYSLGYDCGAAFLQYLEAEYGTDIIKQLNAELYRASYSDEFFFETTGKNLDTLWEEFQETPYFTQGAERSLVMQQRLGIEPGNPPKDAVERLYRYLENTTGAAAERYFSIKYDRENPPPIEIMIHNFLYTVQSGGPPEGALMRLRASGELPGVVEGDNISLPAEPRYDELASQKFPRSKTIQLHKENDPSIYHYVTTLASEEDEWKLEKAWRTDEDGNVVEEFEVR